MSTKTDDNTSLVRIWCMGFITLLIVAKPGTNTEIINLLVFSIPFTVVAGMVNMVIMAVISINENTWLYRKCTEIFSSFIVDVPGPVPVEKVNDTYAAPNDNPHPQLVNLLTQMQVEQPQVFDNLDLLRPIAKKEFRNLENQIGKKVVRGLKDSELDDAFREFRQLVKSQYGNCWGYSLLIGYTDSTENDFWKNTQREEYYFVSQSKTRKLSKTQYNRYAKDENYGFLAYIFRWQSETIYNVYCSTYWSLHKKSEIFTFDVKSGTNGIEMVKGSVDIRFHG